MQWAALRSNCYIYVRYHYLHAFLLFCARYGRKIILYISAVLQLFLGVGVAFVPEYYSFLVIRFLYGIFGSAGAYITAFVLCK
jgi:MFS family permease